jgi:ubiquinone/menaquinone biosynthesis C-methylase UbiE
VDELDRDTCSPGASAWYAGHARPEFLEACYGSAPPRVKAALEEEIRWLRRTLEGPRAILEIGCGDGRVIEAVGASGARWTGIDFLEPYLHQARVTRRLPARTSLVTASAGDLPFAGRSFDAVVCAQNTFGLLGDLKARALGEAARVARPGGLVVLVVYSQDSMVPRAEWYTEMHRRGAMAPIDWARSGPELLVTGDGHGSECFRRERLERLLGDAGLAARIDPVGGIYWAAVARAA